MGPDVAARTLNASGRGAAFYAVIVLAVATAALTVAALVRTVTTSTLDPATSAYAATVALLVIWCVVHVVLGIVMRIYCAARRLAGRMTARHDIDIGNVTLYWHFTAATVVLAMAVVGGFPTLG